MSSPIESHPPALELARVGPSACLYCLERHQVRVELKQQRLWLDADAFFALLQQVFRPESRQDPCGPLDPEETGLLKELLARACSTLVLLLLRNQEAPPASIRPPRRPLPTL